ncbi:MAG: UDP-N-acetylglucosamine--N-acetylmuramyl-(pentapeptide) pyrophosphoryl-undecaprenol N-acetylglucosamine transferase [Amaricoccus sp.]|uniref:UDP-N-acetylglucosamine--N-acetylmuramyl- (pentapeptide) pyrophosphoryl-undecaprenol N-acetylglucosamine transferase n=1 Tax=Amaricoccus sp. TaxID=1872485 RepID=UPI0039E6DD22
MPPRLVIAAGGTGGHMFPAQALAEEMLARGWRVTLATDARGARYAGGFPDAVERQATPAATFAQGSAWTRATAPLAIAAGALATIRAMRRDRPAVVAGFGGYPALPAMIAARALKLPCLIHEQNGVLGRVNRAFAARVDVVACGTWPTPVPAGARAVAVGNPVRAAVLAEAAAPYPVPEPGTGGGPVDLLVIGGSQGAGLFGRVVPAALGLLPEALRARIRLSQQVRSEDMDRVRMAYDEMGLAAELRGFFDDVPARLAAASLVVSRAGASSIADITVVGRPAVLIPYAAAMDDHQAANAAGLVSAGGAFMLREAELTAERLAGHIAAIIGDPDGARAMAAASLSVGRPHATTDLAALVEELAEKGHEA